MEKAEKTLSSFLKLAEKKRRLLAEICHPTSAKEERLENVHRNISAQCLLTGWLRVAFEGKNFLSLVFFFTDIVRKMILTLLTCHVHEFRGKVAFCAD